MLSNIADVLLNIKNNPEHIAPVLHILRNSASYVAQLLNHESCDESCVEQCYRFVAQCSKLY